MTPVCRASILFVSLLAVSPSWADPQGVWRCTSFPKGGAPFETLFEFTADGEVSRVESTMPMRVFRSEDTEIVAWTDTETGFEYRGRFSAQRIDGALSSKAADDSGGEFQCEPDAHASVAEDDSPFGEEQFLPPGAKQEIAEAMPEPEPRSKPKAKSMVAPAYPVEAMDAEIEGRVVVCFYVDRRGRILEPLVMESSDEIFETPVLKALARSAYRPAEDEDQPARTHMCRTYKFWLD